MAGPGASIEEEREKEDRGPRENTNPSETWVWNNNSVPHSDSSERIYDWLNFSICTHIDLKDVVNLLCTCIYYPHI